MRKSKVLIIISLIVLLGYPFLLQSMDNLQEGTYQERPLGNRSVERAGGTLEEIGVKQKVTTQISRKTLLDYRKVEPGEDVYLFGLFVLPRKHNLLNKTVLYTFSILFLVSMGWEAYYLFYKRNVKLKWS